MAYFQRLTLQSFAINKRFNYRFHQNMNFPVIRSESGKISIHHAILLALGDSDTIRICVTMFCQFASLNQFEMPNFVILQDSSSMVKVRPW